MMSSTKKITTTIITEMTIETRGTTISVITSETIAETIIRQAPAITITIFLIDSRNVVVTKSMIRWTEIIITISMKEALIKIVEEVTDKTPTITTMVL